MGQSLLCTGQQLFQCPVCLEHIISLNFSGVAHVTYKGSEAEKVRAGMGLKLRGQVMAPTALCEFLLVQDFELDGAITQVRSAGTGC